MYLIYFFICQFYFILLTAIMLSRNIELLKFVLPLTEIYKLTKPHTLLLHIVRSKSYSK